MNILKWFGWEETKFDESRRLFLRKGAAFVLAPVVVPKAITYFFPQQRLVDPFAGGTLMREPFIYQPLYSSIDSTTLEAVRRSVIYDNFFSSTPFLAKFRGSEFGHQDNLVKSVV